VERLLINPRRLADTGALEILDAAGLRIEALVITQPDVDALVNGQPVGSALSVTLGDGSAEVTLKHFPAVARVVAAAGVGDQPFTIKVEGLTVPDFRVPGALVHWVARHFDPTARLKNLPVPVSLGRIRITSGRLEVGTPAH
jgi:hypothetical protein